MTVAILPMSSLQRAKSRLADVLPDETRQRLVVTMFEDVLAALRACQAVSSTLVVTPDETISELAEARGVSVIRERAMRGLNPAIARACVRVRRGGAQRLLIVPGDIPLASADEFSTVLQALDAGHDIAVVPAHDGLGTNALAMAAGVDFAPLFGMCSHARHLAQAKARGLTACSLRLTGIGRDIDLPTDLHELAVRDCAGRYDFLRDSGRVPRGRLGSVNFGGETARLRGASSTTYQFQADSEETL
ncbi:2-phospho-L-lactate guanylyltransferase [Dichotomicrobium thermohalophilum]|uniref:3-phospho-D-glycerate guanylyltransferase n=1 Tax=Dichotomicrobium thermohalophilum TaxID=933063 RepID=A0A397PK56_9HYPH|nr:2-phospho-L-lactate guanylyltransferase [Dichotomicrobium thermohalophilum]RIA47655.1 2-phospho-L-lactate guanylyltransferase [Dichotomicrobium thermohalophilum]